MSGIRKIDIVRHVLSKRTGIFHMTGGMFAQQNEVEKDALQVGWRLSEACESTRCQRELRLLILRLFKIDFGEGQSNNEWRADKNRRKKVKTIRILTRWCVRCTQSADRKSTNLFVSCLIVDIFSSPLSAHKSIESLCLCVKASRNEGER